LAAGVVLGGAVRLLLDLVEVRVDGAAERRAHVQAGDAETISHRLVEAENNVQEADVSAPAG
jgi:hypothetical protein